MSVRILVGDCRTRLRELPEQSVQTCVTSPPYFGLRDYGMADQIGLEQTPDAFVAELVAVFREVKRVLRDDGTLWLNLGDSYASMRDSKATPDTLRGESDGTLVESGKAANRNPANLRASGLKHKDLIGIPWRVAFALQADGWYLRQDIIWHKPNPMPESVKDRCTKAHEYIFLLTKSDRYFYDAEAVAEDSTGGTKGAAASFKREDSKRGAVGIAPNSPMPTHRPDRDDTQYDGPTRNRRSVWTVATKPYSGAHFATFPPALIEPCIKAGSKAGDVVLDPFGGAGTTGLVADRLGRDAILCELNPEYAKMAGERIAGENPMFTQVSVE
jgi:DNA modification methylase